eukprot:CAMPEP_0176010050 /NCGR_PEP_ID=MMETSP0120_2-20121206/4564_1 /TAXON_ID=160619 /ORGANISM="Kryptoperidinium foliaceum, Strain CCMP 1326" /LENGTH=127 /DNA_ID=CAMNT_0017342861 /DNA_START=163 /DNA_END=543 /DNA_ORIENTATION=-
MFCPSFVGGLAQGRRNDKFPRRALLVQLAPAASNMPSALSVWTVPCDLFIMEFERRASQLRLPPCWALRHSARAPCAFLGRDVVERIRLGAWAPSSGGENLCSAADPHEGVGSMSVAAWVRAAVAPT